MLTKTDLKQIGTIVDERLDKRLDENLKPIKNDFKGVKKTLDSIKKTLGSVKKTLDIHIRQTDRHLNYHHRRLVQLEEKAGVKPPPFLPNAN
ncbi:MAG: hypothetical protein ACOY0S_00090 [Patescibacteria group bacterium]